MEVIYLSKVSVNLNSDKIGRLLLELSIPSIIAQIVNILYNIIDRIFIGRMSNGALAMAGVGVAFPIIIIISAFSCLIGMGGAPKCAIKMGEKDNDTAEKIISNSFSMLIIISILLTIFILIFRDNLLWTFGASTDTIKYAKDYLTIYTIGTIFVQIALGMNPFINTQGFAKIGMKTVLIGAILNIVLDPIFIFAFNMGVKGAALATVISQFISAIWVLFFLFGKKSIVKIKIKYLIPESKIIFPIIALGISPFIMQSTESLVLISLNTRLKMYGGDLAVSAMTIMSSIMQIIILPLTGLAQGAQPIISYNYGAKRIDKVKKTFYLLFTISLSFTLIITTLVMLFPSMFVKIFNDNPALIQITSWSMRIYFAGIFVFGALIACQQTFLALGEAKASLIVALLRKIVLLIPLIFLLPNMFPQNKKLFAVLLAEPISDVSASTIAIITFIIFYKRKLSKMQ